LKRYLLNASGEPRLEIRILSYTSETIARSLPQQIDRYLGLNTPLRIRVLLRSDYDRFAHRPHDIKFNRHIRWTISKAKADWYRWIRKRREMGTSALIELQIR
jgi:hypothetical protein